MIDIAPHDLETVKRLIRTYFPDVEARVFGSRYKWTAKDYSDLDIALVGLQKLDWQTLNRLREALAESDLSFRVDVLDWHTISPEFQQVIEQGYEVIQKQKPSLGSTVWQKVRLDQISQVICGATPSTSVPEYWADEIKWVTAKDVSESTGYKIYDTERKISRLGFDNCSTRMIPKESTVLIARGATMGKSCLLGEDMAINQTCYALVPDREKVDSCFLFYSIKLLDSFFQKIAHGAIFNTVIGSGLRETEIDLPDLHTQQRIAGILAALDEKIELNRQTNATLEAIAQAVFKEWFVNFNYPDATGELVESELGLIPPDWRVGKIRDFTKRIQYGFTQSASQEEIGPRFLRITDIQNGFIDWSNVPFCVADEEEWEKYKIKNYDIVIARTGASTGENTLIVNPPNAVFASYLIRLQFSNNELALFMGKLLRSKSYFAFVDAVKSGSAQPNANAQQLTDFAITLPPDELLKLYFRIVENFEYLKVENQNQSTSLIQIRDALLPKLMRGEVVV